MATSVPKTYQYAIEVNFFSKKFAGFDQAKSDNISSTVGRTFMFWNLFPYAIPLFGAVKTFSALYPMFYREYEEAPESPHSATVAAVAERVLNAEFNSGAGYQENIQEMIQELPDSVTVRNVKAVVANRLKVVEIKNEAIPIHSTGTDIDIGDLKGKFFIGIDPGIARTAQEALPWITTHEICHILERDWVELAGIKTIASLSATILSTVVLGWWWLPSAWAAMAANIITHVLVSHRAENRADDFANKHCSPEECQKAIAYFEYVKGSRPQGGMAAYLGTIIRSALHPSEDARIAKIRETLGVAEVVHH